MDKKTIITIGISAVIVAFVAGGLLVGTIAAVLELEEFKFTWPPELTFGKRADQEAEATQLPPASSLPTLPSPTESIAEAEATDVPDFYPTPSSASIGCKFRPGWKGVPVSTGDNLPPSSLLRPHPGEDDIPYWYVTPGKAKVDGIVWAYVNENGQPASDACVRSQLQYASIDIESLEKIEEPVQAEDPNSSENSVPTAVPSNPPDGSTLVLTPVNYVSTEKALNAISAPLTPTDDQGTLISNALNAFNSFRAPYSSATIPTPLAGKTLTTGEYIVAVDWYKPDLETTPNGVRVTPLQLSKGGHTFVLTSGTWGLWLVIVGEGAEWHIENTGGGVALKIQEP